MRVHKNSREGSYGELESSAVKASVNKKLNKVNEAVQSADVKISNLISKIEKRILQVQLSIKKTINAQKREKQTPSSLKRHISPEERIALKEKIQNLNKKIIHEVERKLISVNKDIEKQMEYLNKLKDSYLSSSVERKNDYYQALNNQSSFIIMLTKSAMELEEARKDPESAQLLEGRVFKELVKELQEANEIFQAEIAEEPSQINDIAKEVLIIPPKNESVKSNEKVRPPVIAKWERKKTARETKKQEWEAMNELLKSSNRNGKEFKGGDLFHAKVIDEIKRKPDTPGVARFRAQKVALKRPSV